MSKQVIERIYGKKDKNFMPYFPYLTWLAIFFSERAEPCKTHGAPTKLKHSNWVNMTKTFISPPLLPQKIRKYFHV